jgi:zinc transporter ZupT
MKSACLILLTDGIHNVVDGLAVSCAFIIEREGQSFRMARGGR